MPRGIQVTTNSPPHPGLSPRSSSRPQNTFLRRSLVERRVRIRCITFIRPENKDFVGIQHHDSSYTKPLVYHFENIHEWENVTPSIHVHIHILTMFWIRLFHQNRKKPNPPCLRLRKNKLETQNVQSVLWFTLFVAMFRESDERRCIWLNSNFALERKECKLRFRTFDVVLRKVGNRDKDDLRFVSGSLWFGQKRTRFRHPAGSGRAPLWMRELHSRRNGCHPPETSRSRVET